jgi:hypothetical protein
MSAMQHTVSIASFPAALGDMVLLRISRLTQRAYVKGRQDRLTSEFWELEEQRQKMQETGALGMLNKSKHAKKFRKFRRYGSSWNKKELESSREGRYDLLGYSFPSHLTSLTSSTSLLKQCSRQWVIWHVDFIFPQSLFVGCVTVKVKCYLISSSLTDLISGLLGRSQKVTLMIFLQSNDVFFIISRRHHLNPL